MSWPRVYDLPYASDSTLYFERLRDMPTPVWLDSGSPGVALGRYDVLAAEPTDLLRGMALAPADLLGGLRKLLGEAPASDQPALPFCGGLIGFFGYELGRVWQGLPQRQRPRLAEDYVVGLYDWAVVVDHQRQRAYLVGQGRSARTRQRWSSLCARFSSVSQRAQPVEPIGTAGSPPAVELGMSQAAYAEAFARIEAYIRAGDSYQINLTRRFGAGVTADAWDLYRQLRALSPAPYGAYLDLGDYQILCNSPEQFLACEARQVRTRPIKGTRARGNNAQADAELRAELLASAKDRAENLMIVDLLRNDIGRVCQPGSIEVPELFALESYATVHHLVSTVRGRLAKPYDALDLLHACFPGGSITGAPKRRAMQIIDELEPVSREVYCGSVFRLGYDGNLDSNISIRTLLKRGEQLHYWAGGGIVADSDCQAEYQESRTKAEAFYRLLGAADVAANNR